MSGIKRSGSASLPTSFRAKKQTSVSSGLKKAEHGREPRSWGLSNRSASLSLDGLPVAGEGGDQQHEVTSPPPQSLQHFPTLRVEPASPKASLVPDSSVLSSPFAAWRTIGFDESQAQLAAKAPQPSTRGRSFTDDICQLATPGGAAAAPSGSGDASAKGDVGRNRMALGGENDENFNWLISPVRPPRRSPAAALLLTPEKDGSSLQPMPIQSMPSLSSWMVSATKPPPRGSEPAPTVLHAGAMDEVLASLSFNPDQPRRLDRAPSPLDRLLGEIGDSDFAASVAQWDKEEEKEGQQQAA